MKRQRKIAAAPVRSAVAAWKVTCQLIVDTLDQSPHVSASSVTTELARLDGVGPALIAGGHLETKGLVLEDEDLHITFFAPTADAALGVEENLNAVPGGASATNGWTLYIPTSDPLKASVVRAISGSKHLSTDAPRATNVQQESKADDGGALVDVDALRRMGGS
jgi:hypothetical protein